MSPAHERLLMKYAPLIVFASLIALLLPFGFEGQVAADTPPADPVVPSAYVVIQNAAPNDAQRLVRQLQQVLPKTQVVKQVQSPDPREIKLEVTNIKDVRALANKIPFASVESVDVATRTITVDFDL
ncbi:MAG: hypothetical protein AB8C95_15095 [Phycisphaeraceae bacterium]